METKLNSKITLVGAGPGDPELITLKGLLALGNAEVVLYDALVSKEVLNYAEKAIKVYVGKRLGKGENSQESINKLIIQYASKYKNVVRLKGGDSFVFGRGYEELLYARSFGYETEVIPGISSSLSVPALAGIPVTHRGLSKSFHVITATQRDGKFNQELAESLNYKGTVVILMGLHLLNEISKLFVEAGKGDLLAAIILDGSLPTEEQHLGTIKTLPELFQKSSDKPGIIVIGHVVSLKSNPKTVAYDLAFEGLKNNLAN